MTAPKKYTHEEILSHMDGHLAAPEPAETDDNAARYIDCLHEESAESLKIVKQLLAEVEAVTEQKEAWERTAEKYGSIIWSACEPMGIRVTLEDVYVSDLDSARELLADARELDPAPAISETETTQLDHGGTYCHHDTLVSCSGEHQDGSWCHSCEKCSCDIQAATGES